MKNPKKFLAILLLLGTASIISACGTKKEEKKTEIIEPLGVSARMVKDSKTLEETLEFPGIISSEQEAKIIAKVGGTVKNFSFAAGDKVSAGQILLNVDDAKGAIYADFDSAQIRQAQIGVSLAQSSLHLAETSYANILEQATKDLEQAEIAKNQAVSGKDNLSASSQESIKSAELLLEQAMLGTGIAKNNLDKQKKIIGESNSNNISTARISMTSVRDQSLQIIDGINQLTALDDKKTAMIDYKNNLGARDLDSYTNAKTSYFAALLAYDAVQNVAGNSDNTKADEIIKLATAVKKLTDASKLLFDNSISSQNLPASSPSGISLSGLKAQASAFQNQANALVSAANALRQLLTTTDLSSDLNISNLENAYELAKKQEDSASQALNTLRAGNKSGNDQASFGASAAKKQYEATKNRLELQKQAAKSQADVAALSYQNALTALDGLYDIHQNVSPIDGIVVKKSVNDGETVSAGQELAIVSQPGLVRMEFFVDEENVRYMGIGGKAEIRDNSGNLISATISALTPLADSQSKRFSVEIKPELSNEESLPLGTIMTAIVKIKKSTLQKENVILPLSAIEVNQNDNTIYTISDGKAKKEKISIERVIGEAAEIKTSLSPDAYIVIAGTKNIKEGEDVVVNK